MITWKELTQIWEISLLLDCAFDDLTFDVIAHTTDADKARRVLNAIAYMERTLIKIQKVIQE